MAMDLTGRIIGAESGGNPLARNPRSSAGGLGQFINSTWLSTIRKHRPDLANRSNSELLRLKFDPSLSKAMTAAYAADNQGFLKSKGIDPTPGNTYLAHFAGPQGAAAIHANPNAPIEQLMGASAVAANPFLRGKTGADVINWASGKVGANAPASKHMAANAVNQVANGAPMATPIGGAPIAGGPVPLQPLTPPSERRSRLADMLLAQAAGAKVSGWGDALRAAGGAALGYTMGEKADKQQGEYRSKLAEMLSGASNENLPATLMGSGDEDLMKAGVQLKVAQAKPESKVGRFRPSKQGIVDTVTGQVVPGTEASGADAAEFGTSPQYYRDKDGNLKIGQLSKAGGMKPVELPEGAAVLPGIDYKDVGTGFVGFDKRTGEAVGPMVPKDITGEKSQEVIGKEKGQAMTSLPTVEDTTVRLMDRLDRLDKSPMRESFTGYSGYLPNVSPEANDYKALLDEVQGNTFLQAFQNLRGGGAITEIEGQKATSALTRLQQTAPSDAGYQQALNDARSVFQEIRDNVRKRAGVGGNEQASPAPQAPKRLKFNPATGELE